jgi:hypothetical protein
VPLFLAAAVAAGIGGACSSDSSGPEEDGFADCLELSFARTAGQPLDEIAIGRLPGDFEEPVAAEILGADGTVAGYAPVWVAESGDAHLIVPVHPSTPLESGPVQLALTDSSSRCAPVDFTIEALPEADGELDAVADLLGGMLDDAATLLGTSTEEIFATDAADLAPVYYPLAAAASVLAHPDNSYSIAAILDGSSPLSDADGLELAERLFAKAGIRDGLAATVAAARVSPPARIEEPDVECTPDYIDDDAGRLDACMDLALDVTSSITGATGQILEDLSNLFAVTGLAPHPAIEIGSAVAGLAVYIVQARRNRLAALLPSSLTSMDVDFGQTEWLEDEPGPGEISKAEVYATNDEWDMGKAFLETALAAAGFGRALEKYGGVKALNDIGVFLVSEGLIPHLLGDETLDEFTLDAVDFGPVDVLSPAWTDITVPLGDAIEFTSHTAYDLKKVGTATVLVHTDDGEFGGQRRERSTEVTVRQLSLQIYPDEVVVEPGEITFFTLAVENSFYPHMVDFMDGLEIQGSADITIQGEGFDSHEVSYTAPQSPDASMPDLLTIEHKATSGARSGDAPPRRAIATIRFGGLRITTEPRCVDIGEEPFPIDVEVAGGIQDPELVWNASAGAIDENGVFTPPDEAQIVTITVTLADKPGIGDSIELPVGGCSCSATVNLNGASDATFGLRFWLSGDLSGVQAFDWTGEGVSKATFGFGTDPLNSQVIPLGTTGQFDALASGVVNGVTFLNPEDPDNPALPPLSLSITENTGSIFAGTVAGTVKAAVGAELESVSFSLSFHIEADPNYSEEDEKVCYVDP